MCHATSETIGEGEGIRMMSEHPDFCTDEGTREHTVMFYIIGVVLFVVTICAFLLWGL